VLHRINALLNYREKEGMTAAFHLTAFRLDLQEEEDEWEEDEDIDEEEDWGEDEDSEDDEEWDEE
jgi:hypothetical protein